MDRKHKISDSIAIQLFNAATKDEKQCMNPADSPQINPAGYFPEGLR